MELSSEQIVFLNKWGKTCFQNKDIELECVSKFSQKKITDFKNVMKFANDTWTRYTENPEITLDILCDDDIRVTIYGLDQIKTYCRDETLKGVKSLSIMRKTPEDSLELNEYGFRVNVKKEEKIEMLSEEFAEYLYKWKDLDKSFRLKNRYSYLIENAYNLDLTVVKSNSSFGKNLKKSKTFKGSQTKEADECYEVELEYVPHKKQIPFSTDTFVSLLHRIYCAQNDVRFVIKKSEQNSLELEYKEVFGSKNISFSQNKNILIPGPQVVSMNVEKFNIMLGEIQNEKNKYTLTSKTDGMRMIGFIAKNGSLYFMNSTEKGFVKSDISFHVKYAGTVFDGEFVRTNKIREVVNRYLVFDCYFVSGQDIRFENLTERIKKANSIVQSLFGTSHYPNIIVKDFISLTQDNFHDECKKLLAFLENECIFKDDGLIFTPDEPLPFQKNEKNGDLVTTSSPWSRLLKWKPAIENTIDFRVIFSDTYKESDLQLVTLKTKMNRFHEGHTLFDFLNMDKIKSNKILKNPEEIEFLPENVLTSCITYIATKNNLQNKIKIPVCENGDEIQNGAIVEMKYVHTNHPEKRWVPRNVRFDKIYPNPTHVAEEIWNIIHNPVQKEFLTNKFAVLPPQEQYYVPMESNNANINFRRFHTTFVKHKLFVDTHENIRNPRILDLASGVGGDLNRYNECGAKEVVGVEKMLNNLHDPQIGAYKKLCDITKKKNKYFPKVLFLHGDISSNLANGDAFKNSSELYKNNAKSKFLSPFDSVSIMFAIHYLFENTTSFSNLLKNVNENLKPGGYFFGCCYDGEKLFSLLANEQKLTFSNSQNSQQNEEFLSIERRYDPTQSFEPTSSCLGKEIFATVQSIGKGFTEYLVNFTFLKNEMKKIGFECVHTTSFEDYYVMQENKYTLTEQEKKASFLNRTFVFKKGTPTEKIKIKIKNKSLTKKN